MSYNPPEAVDAHDLPRGRVFAAHEMIGLGLRFFHVSLVLYAAGERLHSKDYRDRPQNNFFREPPPPKFLGDPKFENYRRLEMAFESVRQGFAPQAPSRRSAIFCFPCRECAVWFRDRSRTSGTLLELQPTSTSSVFLTDLVWRNVASNVLGNEAWREPEFPFRVHSQARALKRVAEAYWRGEDPRKFQLDTRPEALIVGEAVVVAEVGQ